jgi:hypothetical protein
MAEKFTRIRTSSLTRYPDCGRRWAAGIIPDEIKRAGFVIRDDTKNIAPAIGTAVHKSAEGILREKAESGKLPPVTVATDIAVESVREDIRQGISYDTQYTLTASDAERQSAGMAAAYHGHIAPKIEPLMIEERLEAEIPWSVESLVLSGQPDVVAREPGQLRDLKTGVRYGNHNAQAGGYALLLRSNGVEGIDKASIDWMPRVRSSKPQPPPQEKAVPLAIAEASATNILRHIDQDLSVWRHGDAKRGLLPGDPAAFVSNPSSMLCSARYCRAHSCGSNGWCQDWDKGDE